MTDLERKQLRRERLVFLFGGITGAFQMGFGLLIAMKYGFVASTIFVFAMSFLGRRATFWALGEFQDERSDVKQPGA